MCHQRRRLVDERLLLWIVTCWENNLAFLVYQGEPDCYDCLQKLCYYLERFCTNANTDTVQIQIQSISVVDVRRCAVFAIDVAGAWVGIRMVAAAGGGWKLQT